MNTNLSSLRQVLSTPQRIAIVTHTNPDGDAIGSSLGLYHFLYSLRIHHISIITPTPYPTYLHFMPANERVNIYTHNTPRCQQLVADATLIFVLDCNTAHRMDELGKHVAQATATKVLIDHHLAPDIAVDFALWDTTASSTAELVYDFTQIIKPTKRLPEAGFLCLYTGIATDTGRFKHNTTAKTLQTVSYLIDGGLDLVAANNLIFDNSTHDRLRLLGFVLSQRLVMLPNAPIAYIYLSLADLAPFNYQTGDLEGVVNYPLSIVGVQMVALIKEQTDEVRLSMRSKGSVSVNDLARDHFDGGGHRNAAGGRSTLNLADTIARFCAVSPHYVSPTAASVINHLAE